MGRQIAVKKQQQRGTPQVQRTRQAYKPRNAKKVSFHSPWIEHQQEHTSTLPTLTRAQPRTHTHSRHMLTSHETRHCHPLLAGQTKKQPASPPAGACRCPSHQPWSQEDRPPAVGWLQETRVRRDSEPARRTRAHDCGPRSAIWPPTLGEVHFRYSVSETN